jgi:hypothetical protein
VTDSNGSDSGKVCFIVMPITTPPAYCDRLGDSDHFAHVLAHLFIPAIKEAGLTPVAPMASGSDLIHAQIIKNLEIADFVLGDLSDLNPNVLFELGIRTSLDRSMILVKDDLTSKVPFDVNAINTYTYGSSLKPWSLDREVLCLAAHIKEVTGAQTSGNSMWHYFGLTKPAKPSEAGENSLEAKVDLLLKEVTMIRSRAFSPSPPIAAAPITDSDLTHKIDKVNKLIDRVIQEVSVHLKEQGVGVSEIRLTGADKIYVQLDEPEMNDELLRGIFQKLARRGGIDFHVEGGPFARREVFNSYNL